MPSTSRVATSRRSTFTRSPTRARTGCESLRRKGQAGTTRLSRLCASEVGAKRGLLQPGEGPNRGVLRFQLQVRQRALAPPSKAKVARSKRRADHLKTALTATAF